MTLKYGLSCLMVFFGYSFAAFAGPVTLADLDHDFSLTEGTAGWTYGYYAAPFTPASFSTAGTVSTWHYALASGGSFQIYNDGVHTFFAPQAGNTPDNDPNSIFLPVARWKDASYTGSVTISGYFYKQDGTAGNFVPNILPFVYVNGTKVFSATLTPGSTGQIPYSFTTNLTAGDNVDFGVGLPAGYDYNGFSVLEGKIDTAADASVSPTPEPASLTMLGLGGIFCLLGSKRLKASRS